MRLLKVTRTIYILEDDMVEEGDAFSDYFANCDVPMYQGKVSKISVSSRHAPADVRDFFAEYADFIEEE